MEKSIIKTIDLKNIIYNATLENKSIVVSMIALFSAHWLQDVIFPEGFSKFTTNVPEFISNISYSSVFKLLFPYLVAELLFYINNIVVAKSIPNIELSVVKQITNEMLESLKTSKKTINVNEFIMNLKKIIELKSIYYLVVSYIVPTILVAVGMLYYFLKGDVKTSITVTIIIAIFMYITFTFESQSIKTSYTNENSIDKFYDDIQDIISNYDTVITSNTHNWEMKNLNINELNVREKYISSELYSSSSSFKLHVVSLVTTILLNGLSFKMYIDNKIPKESLISIALISILFMQYYNATIIKLKNTVHSIGKICEINDYFSTFKIHDTNIPLEFKIKEGSIDLKNINLKYETNKIINNFNYFIPGGTKIGIMGKVGKGKTSMLKMIAGLVNYDGEIYIDNQNIKLYDYDSAMQHIAYIPQHPKMFNNTIYYNLTYGAYNMTIDKVNNFLKSVNFINFFKSFKYGLDTQVGKEGSKLSGGQKQIIAFLRALLKNKKIILLDEPTSSLDPITKKLVLDLIENTKNKTMLIVSHDPNTKKLFDKIIQL